MQNLFYDELLDQTVEIWLDGNIQLHLKMTFEDDIFYLENLSSKESEDRKKKWTLEAVQ